MSIGSIFSKKKAAENGGKAGILASIAVALAAGCPPTPDAAWEIPVYTAALALVANVLKHVVGVKIPFVV